MNVLARVLSILILFFLSAQLNGAEKPVCRVAVFEEDGVGPSSEQLITAITEAKGRKLDVFRISAEQICSGGLQGVDVLVHPGGSGSKQGRALGDAGRKAIREHVHEGGGFLGVCAGAYLASNDYDWSLNLIDAKVLDRRHWNRGKGMVNLRLSPAGKSLFQHGQDEMAIQYEQGPLLSRHEWDDPNVPNYESLAIFTTEVVQNGAPKGVMARTSAAVRCQYGRGRVLCYSPHPELTDGLHHLIPLAIRWVARTETARPGEVTEGAARGAPLIGIASLSDDKYVRSVLDAGGTPLVLPKADGNTGRIAQYLELLDGLLMPGGPDIPPAEYGEEAHETVKTLDEDRYQFEKALSRAWIEKTDKPMLGICLGSQWINVSSGGSLVQDIPSALGSNHRNTTHEVILEPGSRLLDIFGEQRIEVNSTHHQAVKRLGKNLKIVARSPDGVVEATETTDPDRFLVGVQWHPEKMLPDDPRQARLLKAFVQAVAVAASRK